MDKVLISSLLSFISGSLFVSVISKLYNVYLFSKFKKMINTEYVDGIEYLDNNGISKLSARLTYLKNHELCYYKNDDQIKYIRFIEFTLMLVKEIQDIDKTHPLLDIPGRNGTKERELQITQKKKVLEQYKLSYSKYSSLKTDYLLTENEQISLKKELEKELEELNS
ncbi:hypothetical protein R82291_FJPPFKPJ_01594 [Fructobacillus cardui]|uniref:hypothetical protein n=1 Tax=Fructobacillus cardui TaxID=2893170 RepID=UPI002D95B14E|nr:hypothetical protein R82291_FJPPFKPJ_01594 [Fructobacillus cardui]